MYTIIGLGNSFAGCPTHLHFSNDRMPWNISGEPTVCCNSTKSQLPSFIPSIVIIGIIFLTLKGGVKRLGSFSSFFLPIMGGCYLIICAAIIIMNLDRIEDICRSIFWELSIQPPR